MSVRRLALMPGTESAAYIDEYARSGIGEGVVAAVYGTAVLLIVVLTRQRPGLSNNRTVTFRPKETMS